MSCDRMIGIQSASVPSIVIKKANSIVTKDLSKNVQPSTKNCSINGLPDLLPVAPRPPPPPPPPPPITTNLAPTGYILVPASAVGIHSITPASFTNFRLISTGSLQQGGSGGTFVVVGASRPKVIQNASSTIASLESTSAIETVSRPGSRICDGETSGFSGGCIVDDASLRQSMGRNRESLKRKLLQRRSIRELVDQGILPPPKTPPSYYEQRIKLERAKMSDILKHKIEHRPDKQQLVSQHILLDSCADPGILEKQQQLKKCKLADSLNEKLANRPGPLELVQENILHVDAALEQAIKDGRLQFKPTSAGLIQKHPQPVFVVTHDTTGSAPTPEHGAFDCTNMSFDPSSALNHSPFNQSSMDMTAPMVSAASVVDQQPTAGAFTTTASAVKPKPKKTKAKVRVAGSGNGGISKTSANGQSTKPPPSAASKLIRFSDSRKASAVENRTNNACKVAANGSTVSMGFTCGNGQAVEKPNHSQSSASPLEDPLGPGLSQQETSYDLLLQQQQLLLQWQYELQQKYPNSTVQLVSLSSAKSPEQQHFSMNFNSSMVESTPVVSSVQSSPGSFGSGANGGCVGGGGGSLPHTPAPLARSDSDGCANANSSSGSTAATKTVKRLEDMKVNDLKLECKRRNLPVSGSKSNIVERLKSFEDVILATVQQNSAAQHQHLQTDSSGSGGAFPASPLCQNANSSANGQQRAALPPISFLCASSGTQNAFASSTASSPIGNHGNSAYGQHNGHASLAQQTLSGADIGSGYVNRSSSCSDFTSNYSSPGIDLSVLNFSNGVSCSGGEDISTIIDSSSATTTTEQYTFSTPNFGAQFLVTSSANGCNSNGSHGNGILQTAYDEPPVSAMDMSETGQNGQVVNYRQVLNRNDAPTPSMGPTATPPLAANAQHYQQQHQPLPFLQAANTLSVHEEVLRQQQKKIEEIQKELQRSQELLRQQQQMILAAKQMQTEANESGMSDAECILSQLDTKQIQKAHIQLFLQQKIQQQQLQQQINVQQELMEIQQKLQEEMTVHQALNEVVRLLRQEPRVSILVLHLLRRHQIEQQQQQRQQQAQQNQSVPTPPATSQHQSKSQTGQSGDFVSDNNADGRRVETGTFGSAKRSAEMQHHQQQPQQAQQSCLQQQQQQYCHRKLSSSPASNSSNGSYQACQNGSAPGSTEQSITDGSELSVASKNRQGSGQSSKKQQPSLQSPLGRANSVPTSPMKSKSNSSMGDMEEIFRSVLDYATKATEKVSGGLEQQQLNTGALPSFDQLLQPSRAVSEIETAITISNGSGILMTSAHGQQQQQLSVLDHLPATTAMGVRRFSNGGDLSAKGATADPVAVNETTQSAGAFMYTRNEAFDDLMEVLRNNEAPLLEDGSDEHPSEINSCPSSLTNANEDSESMGNQRNDLATKSRQPDASVSQAHQQLNLLSAFGAQEVADLLGTEWFNVESLLPQPNGAGMSSGGETLNMTQPQDSNAFGVSVLSSGRAEGKLSASRGDDRNSAGGGAVTLVSSDMNDQMDWLDLILPSPSSAGGNSILNDLPVMNCLPMDTDHGGDSMCRGDSLLNGNSCDDFGAGHSSMLSSTHNPVLAMSACVSGEGL